MNRFRSCSTRGSEVRDPGKVQYQGNKMLRAITPAQLAEVLVLLKQLSEARSARAADGLTQISNEILEDRKRRELIDYLYSLTEEARGELIVLMLVGRGDVDHAHKRAIEIRSKYTSADDQVTYLMSKTFRLAEYLKIGIDVVGQNSKEAIIMNALTWREAEATLVKGSKVIFVSDYPMGKIRIPKGCTAVVIDNDLHVEDCARLVLEPEDKGLRAELNHEHSGYIWLIGPPDVASHIWNDATPFTVSTEG